MNQEDQARLEAIDREIGFYRRRAGQVFFFGLLVEAFILAGKEQIKTPETWTWQRPYLLSLFYFAVAAVGIALGSEYRRRIRYLKDQRQELLKPQGYEKIYPDVRSDQVISEIQVLYVILVFLSSAGILVAWLQYSDATWLAILSLVLSGIALLFGAYWVWRCLKK